MVDGIGAALVVGQSQVRSFHLVFRDVFRLTRGGFFGQGITVCPVLAGFVLCSPGVVLERPAGGGGRHRDKLVSSILGTRSHFFKSR